MNDMTLFDAYRKQNTEPNHDDYCDVEFLLRLWRENKGQYLRPLFGDKLILEKEVEYERGKEQLREDMYKMIRENYRFVDMFTYAMRDNVINSDALRSTVMDQIYGCLRNSDNLVNNNLYLGYTETYENGRYGYQDIKSYTVEFANGRKIQLQNGMKITRAMTQLCAQIGMSDEWEQFRIKHSQVLNQKKLKGTLCLSIHPLDYATASDNDNGWSSCMSWRENGCYRMGTVEMMNSPMVICAYLKSNNQYMSILDNCDWNSKKWRAWIIVTKDVIICNRHYPYHQEHFATQAIEWVRDLVGKAYGWKYEEIHTDFIQYERDTDREVEFRTNYMYNDIGGDDVIGCFREGAKMRNLPGYINFSGPAECMVCGEEIRPDAQEADTLLCNSCRVFSTCHECGCELDEDQCYTGPDGNIYCEECYNEIFHECDQCGAVVDREESREVVFPIYREALNKWMEEATDGKEPDRDNPLFRTWRDIYYNSNSTSGTFTVCDCCAQRLNITQINYRSEIINVPDPHDHNMKSAYDLVNPDDWHWATHIDQISWVDDDDRERAKWVKRFYEINWEVFLQKNFPALDNK